MTVLIIIAFILLSLLVDFFVQHHQQRRAFAALTDFPADYSASKAGARSYSFDEHLLPDGIFASSGHLWGMLTPSGKLRIGVDRLITRMVGSIDSILLPQRGQQVAKGNTLLQIKQGKRVIQLKSPCDGIVEEVNTDLLNKPAILNDGPFGNAWAISVKPNGLASTMKSLLIGEDARDWIKQEIIRMREFLASVSHQPALAQTLQDGGLPAEGVLQQLDDQAWEKFQQEFLSANPQQAVEVTVR